MKNDRLLCFGIGLTIMLLVGSSGIAIGQGGTGRINPPPPKRPIIPTKLPPRKFPPPIRPFDQGVLKIIVLPMTAEAKRWQARGGADAPTDGEPSRIRVTIDESGNVIASQPLQGHPAVLDTAWSDAKQQRFTPATHDGRPVRSVGVIDYVFTDIPWLGILKTVRLPMTAEARQLQARGDPQAPADGTTIRIRVTLDESGKVIAAASAEGVTPPSLSDAALTDARRQSRLVPAVRDGRPQRSVGWIVYIFGDRSN